MTVIAGAALPAYITNNTDWDVQGGSAIPVYVVNDIVVSGGGSSAGSLLIASNLSDLNNVATARTNLGLIAGGAGDIWVEKTGDGMSGMLQIDVPTATARGLLLKTTDNSAVLPLLDLQTSVGVSVVSLRTVISGGSATNNFLNIVGTMPAVPTTTTNGINITITSAGSSSFTNRAMILTYSAGYTGTSTTAGLTVTANIQGTNTAFAAGNVALSGGASGAGTTVGYKIGVLGNANTGAQNIGMFGLATGATVASATNIGVYGTALNTNATSPIQIGGFFHLNGTAYPTWESAALIADNGSTASPPLLVRDGGVKVFKIEDGGIASTKQGGSTDFAKIGGSIFGSFADVSVGGAEADIFTDTLVASSLGTNGDIVFAEYGGNFVTVGTELTQLKLYFDGQNIWDSAGLAPASGTTSWRVVVEIIRVSSTVIRYTVSLNTTGASGYTYCTVGELTGRTLSNTNILKITGTSSGVGSGAGDIVGKMHYVRWWAAA